jgi:DNA segregation ATPase FtsK/SpoIIIE, S-DNA-T family
MYIKNNRQNSKLIVENKKAVKNKAVKKKKSSPKSNSHHLKSFFTFLRSERMIQVYGILMMAFSLLLAISVISYYFTHTVDTNYINDISDNLKPANAAGIIGAYLAYYFVNFLFGVFSVGFSFIFFMMGLKWTFEKVTISIWKISITTILTMAWLSMLLGFIVTEGKNEFIPGYFGAFISNSLLESTGKLVSVLIVVVSLFIIAILCYGFSLKQIPSFLTLFKRERFPKKTVDSKGKTASAGNSAIGASFQNDDTKLPDLYIENRNELQKEYQGNVMHFNSDGSIETNLKPSSGNNKTVNDVFSEDYEFDNGEKIVDEVPFEIIDYSLIPKTAISETDEEDELTSLDVSAEKAAIPLEDYDPRKDLSTYRFPSLDILKESSSKEIDTELLYEELVENKNKIESTLKNFNIPIKSISATIGPTVTLYEIVPAEGIRISKIKNLEDNIALSLAALGIRIIAPIPGKGTIGIEVPNKNPKIVSMKEIIESDKFQNNKYDLPIALGKTISNEAFVVDLAKMPHLLIAGATGQGKSVGLNAIITSLLYKKHPAELKFVMIDPKKVEFSLYSIIEHHYLAKIPEVDEPIITDTKKVIRTLNSLCKEMDDRYDLLKMAKTRNIKEYNAKFCARLLSPNNGHRYLPYIVLIIDEFGDLIMTAGREVETPLARLAQLARAIGIHLIIATQRPSVNIITGTIKANFPSRIAFRVSSKIDSRTILDGNGADQLIGKGDMLISTGSDLIRLQCAFIDTPEVEKLVKYIEEQQAYPEAFMLPDVPEDDKNRNDDANSDPSPDKIDDLLIDAATLIVQTQQGSTSLIQRKLSLGYNRAGRIMDQLEEFGIVGPSAGSKAREVKAHSFEEMREILTRKGVF